MGEKIGIKAFQHAERFFNGTIVTGLEDGAEERDLFNLYPNPLKSGHDLKIQSKDPEELFIFEITDVRGKRVMDFSGTGRNMNISTEGLTPGLYLVTGQSRRGTYTLKLIID